MPVEAMANKGREDPQISEKPIMRPPASKKP